MCKRFIPELALNAASATLAVSRAHAKASAIKIVEEPTAAAIDIRADYVAKNGAPSAAAPKIFFRYYYVNSSTGAKSSTMLAEVTWSEAAADGVD